MIDRSLWFRGRDTDTERFTRELRGALRARRARAARREVQGRPGGAGAASRCAASTSATAAPRPSPRRCTPSACAGGAPAMRNLIVLGTLGNNVPFVGLFGTVLGVIKAFDHLPATRPTPRRDVVEELAEALAATAVGLLVAIPAVVAFNYFSRRAARGPRRRRRVRARRARDDLRRRQATPQERGERRRGERWREELASTPARTTRMAARSPTSTSRRSSTSCSCCS